MNWRLIMIAIALVAVGAPAFAQQTKRETQLTTLDQQAGTRSADPPIACNIFGLDSKQRQRQKELRERLFSEVTQTRELEDGYAVALPATTENILGIAEFVSLERVCCSFFRFEIEVCKTNDPMWFKISGGKGVKEFLSSQFGLK